MGTSSISTLIKEFLDLKGARIDKDGWEIRGGDETRHVIMVHSIDYHADTLTLTVDDLRMLLAPMGLAISEKEPAAPTSDAAGKACD